uniref:Uncharacterized protein n=1 Tax=Lygus hesperus TaxID=30085 RepID=A0A0A9YRN4_LYGHE
MYDHHSYLVIRSQRVIPTSRYLWLEAVCQGEMSSQQPLRTFGILTHSACVLNLCLHEEPQEWFYSRFRTFRVFYQGCKTSLANTGGLRVVPPRPQVQKWMGEEKNQLGGGWKRTSQGFTERLRPKNQSLCMKIEKNWERPQKRCF